MVFLGLSESGDCTVDLDDLIHGRHECIDEDARQQFHQLSMEIVELQFELQREHDRVVTRLKKEGETKRRAANGLQFHHSPQICPKKLIKHPLPPCPSPLLREAYEEVFEDDESSKAITAAHQSPKFKVCKSLENAIGKEVKFLGSFSSDLDITSNGQRRSSSTDSASDRTSPRASSHGSCEAERFSLGKESGTGVARVGRLAALQSRAPAYGDVVLEAVLSGDSSDEEDNVRATVYTTVPKKAKHSGVQSTHSSPLNRQSHGTLSIRSGLIDAAKAGIGRRGAIWVRNSQQLEDDRRRLAALAVGQEDEDDLAPDVEHEQLSTCRSQLRVLVRSLQFEMFFAAVIISNSFFMGVQTEYTVSYPFDDPPPAFYALQFLYAIVFTIELLLRLSAEELRTFFCGQQCHWNMLDVFIVVTSLFEMVTDILYLTSKSGSSDGFAGISNLRIIRIIRITRLIRVFRVARIVRFIRALRTLVYSILCTLKSVVWAILLLLILVYVTGMVFAQAASDHISGGSASDEDEIRKYWGTLPRSMFTLYKSVSGGVSWHDVVEPLSAIHGFWVAVFIGYVSFTFFAVLNVITGVFCQSAIESAQHDQEMQVQAVMQNKNMYTKKIKDLFQDIDADESEYITFTEFERHFKDDKVRAYFASLEIDPSDAWELFKLLDSNNTGIIDAKEFITGCMRLRGQAKAIHIAQLSFENKAIRKKLTNHIDTVEAQLHHLIESLSVDRRPISVKTGTDQSDGTTNRTRTQTDASDATTLGPGHSWYDFQMGKRSTVAKRNTSPAKILRE